MGSYLFRLPDVGEGVAEAEITAWHVAVGDHVDEDQSLVDIMTDKATVDMTSPVTGRVVARYGDVGEMAKVGSTLVELETDGTSAGEEAASKATPKPSAPELGKAPVAQAPEQPIRTVPDATPRTSQPAALPVRRPGDAPLASPATRRRAYELGIPLQFVPGTGPAGRITDQDLDHFVAHGVTEQPRGPLAKRTGIKETKIIGLRRKIAERMQDAKRRIPHFSYVEECDLTELEGLRRELNSDPAEERPKLTLLPFFMRALVQLVPEFPYVNGRFDDEAGVLHSHEGVHIGIATQTPAGLMVPVVRHAEALDLWGCARELARVTAAARTGSAAREELSGSTITLTSLGALGGIAATPVINHPEVAILGPNKLVERPVVVNGSIVVRTMMNISSSFDHRIIDGYDAARFIQQLKRLIERPALLFLEHP